MERVEYRNFGALGTSTTEASLKDGVKLCNVINSAGIEEIGGHIALTGGCLYKEGVRKDIDIILYRRKPEVEINQAKLVEFLISLDITHIREFGRVLKARWEGVEIDIIQPEVVGGEYLIVEGEIFKKVGKL